MKTKIIPSNDLPQCHEFVDPYDTSICEKFEDQKLLIMENFPLDLEFDFLRSFFPDNPTMGHEIALGEQLEEPITDNYNNHILSEFCPDINDGKRFQKNVSSAHKQIEKYIGKAFPNYVITKHIPTWRYNAEQILEMHFDIYNKPNAFWIRLFFNLDDQPRIWRTSYDTQAAFNIAKDRGELSELKNNKTRKNFNQKLNEMLFDSTSFPYHEIHFAPNTAWLVNSQNVAHQLVFGRKMILFTYELKEKSMLDPNKSHTNITKELFRQNNLDFQISEHQFINTLD